MKTLPLARMLAPSFILLAASFAAQSAGAQASATAPTTCKDGTTSTATGRGACSGHGGVQKAAAGSDSGSSPASAAAGTPSSSAPAATPPPSSVPSSGSASKATAPTTSAPGSTASKPANTDPTGATAKCKDGTYSKSQHHSGTCSKHGGVDQWLDGSK
jgi:Protein of unknown function (DUF3761)